MNKTKLLTGILLVLAVLFSQVGTAFAAPAAQDTTTITGTVVSVVPETDETTGVTTVVVTYLDSAGQTQTARISVETAAGLGLVTVDPTTNAVAVVAQEGDTLSLDPATVLPEEETGEEAVHPIASILAKFFGVDPAVVQGYHDDGYGFGVIAQALWMAKTLDEADMASAGLILEAKKTGDYNAFTLPDGSTPTNWGQFKKAVMGKDKKNLGIIVSGHADADDEAAVNNGQGNGKDKDNNPGKGKGKNKNP